MNGWEGKHIVRGNKEGRRHRVTYPTRLYNVMRADSLNVVSNILFLHSPVGNVESCWWIKEFSRVTLFERLLRRFYRTS